jgi:hypothetical protein
MNWIEDLIMALAVLCIFVALIGIEDMLMGYM